MEQVKSSPSWNAGDGYQVSDNYLAGLPDYAAAAAQGAGLDSNYYGGVDDSGKFNMLQYAADTSSNYYNPSNNTLGPSLAAVGAAGSTAGAWGNAAGAVIGSYNNASTDTTSSVLGGAASGAVAGFQVGGLWGAAVGAVVGGLAGFFGSKSKKKQAQKQYQADIAKSLAPYQQEQANYLQKQQLTQAAMSPYAAGYTPGGYQYKNKLFGGNNFASIPQPQSGSLALPSGPPTGTVKNIGDPVKFTTPQASFIPSVGQMQVPSTTFAPPNSPNAPTMPKWSGSKSKDQANADAYLNAMIQFYNDTNQQSQANALKGYAPYFNQGY